MQTDNLITIRGSVVIFELFMYCVLHIPCAML